MIIQQRLMGFWEPIAFVHMDIKCQIGYSFYFSGKIERYFLFSNCSYSWEQITHATYLVAVFPVRFINTIFSLNWFPVKKKLVHTQTNHSCRLLLNRIQRNQNLIIPKMTLRKKSSIRMRLQSKCIAREQSYSNIISDPNYEMTFAVCFFGCVAQFVLARRWKNETPVASCTDVTWQQE